MHKKERVNNKTIIIFILLTIILLSSCKRYKENTLLVVPPEVALEKLSGASIVYCKINGIDSTDLMRSILPTYTIDKFNYDVQGYGIRPSSSFYHNCFFSMDNTAGAKYYVIWFSKDKESFTIRTNGMNRLLPKYGDLKFDILKLTFRELKITTYKDHKRYEIYLAK